MISKLFKAKSNTVVPFDFLNIFSLHLFFSVSEYTYTGGSKHHLPSAVAAVGVKVEYFN